VVVRHWLTDGEVGWDGRRGEVGERWCLMVGVLLDLHGATWVDDGVSMFARNMEMEWNIRTGSWTADSHARCTGSDRSHCRERSF
jgi:hypothetical protein